jgi:hypothetical protein
MPDLDYVRAEIERMRAQVGRHRKGIQQLQRAGMPTASAVALVGPVTMAWRPVNRPNASSKRGCDARRGVVAEGGHVGAVAFSRTGDPATGDFSDAKVITKFGDVPDDLSGL